MPIAIKKTAKSITTTTINKMVATVEKIPGVGMVAHVTIPIEMGKLRYKGGKSAYFTFGAWLEGQKGFRVQGNIFVAARRLRPETIEQAAQNYRNKGMTLEDAEETEEEEELF